MKRFNLEGAANSLVKLPRWLKRCCVPLVMALSVLLVACDGSSDDTSARQVSQIGDSDVQGAAVKGPLKDAVVSIYALDLSADDLKGSIIGTGTTNDEGQFQGLQLPGSNFREAPFLIEVTDGLELDGSEPAISTLRTILTGEALGSDLQTYATPFSTMLIEMARLDADLSDPVTASSNFNESLDTQADRLKELFGLGLLNSVRILNTPPLPSVTVDGSINSSTLGSRTANEVLAALIVRLNTIDPNVEAVDLLLGLAQDLSDGDINGMAGSSAIVSLQQIPLPELEGTFNLDTLEIMALMVPGTMTPVAGVNGILLDEASDLLGEDVDLLAVPVIEPLAVPGIDKDGDGVIDSLDAFELDPLESEDVDGDGFGDNNDGCLDIGAGHTDTDGDGFCSDDGSVPLDLYPEDSSRVSLADNIEPTAVITDLGAPLRTWVTQTPDAGGSSDVENDPLTYDWGLVTPSGSSISLSDEAAVRPYFTPDVEGTYTLTLKVIDQEESDPVSASITVSTAPGPEAPSAKIYYTPAVVVVPVDGSVEVTLDARRSSDSNRDDLTYLWEVTDSGGLAVTLSSSTEILPTFTADVQGAYSVSLTVNDGALSDTSLQTILTTEGNVEPTANAGPDREEDYVADGLLGITVDASGSFDANTGDTLTYSWQFVGRPFAGKAYPVITNPNSAVASFDVVMDENTEIGVYTLEVTVSDGVISSTDTVAIDIQKPWLSAAMLYGSALVSFALLTLPARRRRKAARLLAEDR